MVRTLAKTGFFIGLVAVISLSLLPHESVPETGLWDKWNHALHGRLDSKAHWL